MKSNIALVCPLNNFKKNVAKILAHKLKMFFADVDDIIDYENTSLKELVKLNGENYFEKVEASTIKNVCEFQNAVIVTSITSILNEDNLKIIKNSCVVIYLQLTKKAYSILKREENIEQNSKLILDEIVFSERDKLFTKAADIVITVKKPKEKNAVADVVKYIKKFYGVK